MNIAFAGFRHSHIFGLYNTVLNNSDVNITGCFENDENARKSASETHNIAFNYATYQDILDDKTVDAVAIGDYYGIRGQMVISALSAGKHVICDKPICTDLKELDAIEKLAKENNLQVCCMLDLRYMPQIPEVCRILKNGELGDVINVSFTGQHFLDYGNRPGWYFEKGKHGGTINDIAIHGIDLVRFITGKNLTKINCVKTWNAFADKEPDFKDCGQFIIEMDGVSVMGDVSYAAPGYKGIMPTYWNFKFWCRNGMLTFSYCDNKIHIFRNDETIIECKESIPGYLDDFIKEINGVSTIMNTADILESQRQVLQMEKSAVKGFKL